MFEPRWYQREAVDSIFSYFQVAKGNPIIALPTGTGKSIVIAIFTTEALQFYPSTRVWCLTHVKELIEQNAEKLYAVWPQAPLGIYSAGLKRRDIVSPILFAGIASIVKHLDKMIVPNLILIDECHLVGPSESAMYAKLIAWAQKLNPFVKVIGLSATPWRAGVGSLTEGGIFTDVCYNMCNVEGWDRLIADGYLVPLIPKRSNVELDVSSVSIRNGEFSPGQLEAAVDRSDITLAALREACQMAHDRRSWLMFASGIEHSEHIAETLNSFGIPCAAVHSRLSQGDRDARIKAFKKGELRALSNNNIFTTGQDHPPIDFIGMLRPTMSSSLWVQMCGRGTRPSHAKLNCLVADFARNTERLGPINDPVIPNPKGKSTGEIPIKLCPHCGAYNHTRVRFCCECGAEFEFEVKITKTAGTQELLKTNIADVRMYNVDNVMYAPHKKWGESTETSIKVSYCCGLMMFQEWINFEGSGMWRKRSRDWWRQRYVKLPTEFVAEPPETNSEALQKISRIRAPRLIRVHVNKKPYPEILDCEF